MVNSEWAIVLRDNCAAAVGRPILSTASAKKILSTFPTLKHQPPSSTTTDQHFNLFSHWVLILRLEIFGVFGKFINNRRFV